MTKSDSIEQFDSQIKQLEEGIAPLNLRIQKLKDQRRKLVSEKFIEDNKVTKEEIEFSNNEEVYFQDLTELTDYIHEKEKPKKFLEWNGQILLYEDISWGKYLYDQSGRVEDLPETSPEPP